MLALLALAFVLGAALARRMVPEPWATVGRRAGRALAAGARRLDHDHARRARRCAAVLGGAVRAVGARAAAAGLRVRRRAAARRAAVAGLDVRGARRGRRLGAGGLDAARAAPDRGARRRRGAGRLARLLRDGQRPLLRRPDPRSAGTEALPDLPFGYLERLPRLAGLWLDREAGLLRWAPLLALVFFAGWLLYRSRRDQLARVAPARREAEACAGLLLGVVGAQVLVVALFSAGGLRGATFPGVPLVAALPAIGALAAWGLRHVPRLLAGVLALFTLGASAWLVLAGRSGRLAGWLESTPRRRGGRRSWSSPTSPARRCGRRWLCGLLAAGWRAVVARAARRGRVAPRGGRGAHLQGAALTWNPSSSPPIRSATTRCARRPRPSPALSSQAAALPGPRSPRSPAELAAAVAAIDPLPEQGAPLAQVLEDVAPVLAGGIRLGDPRRRTPAPRAADLRRRPPSSPSA